MAPDFARVTRTRLEVLRRIFTELGLPEDEADARAWPVYGFYIGHHQLDRSPEQSGIRPQRLDHVVGLLASPATRPGHRYAGGK